MSLTFLLNFAPFLSFSISLHDVMCKLSFGRAIKNTAWTKFDKYQTFIYVSIDTRQWHPKGTHSDVWCHQHDKKYSSNLFWPSRYTDNSIHSYFLGSYVLVLQYVRGHGKVTFDKCKAWLHDVRHYSREKIVWRSKGPISASIFKVCMCKMFLKV